MSEDIRRKVLVVDDVKSISTFVCRQIKANIGLEAISSGSFAETREILEKERDFLLALLDLNLPDAPNGEIVDYVLSLGIPSIVLTASFDEKIREVILEKNVVDYLIKDGIQSLKQINYLVRRLYRNQSIRVLCVDDSRSFRNLYKSFLSNHMFQVLEAVDGMEALEILKSHPDIKLIITDYNMPNMDGFQLVSETRKIREKDELAIIGVSAQGTGLLSAKFLKNGANDFLTKPFTKEEFHARINQNIELLEYIAELKEIATRDPLTKLFNRRFYFQNGEKRFKECLNKNIPVAIGMVDIDFFKSVNDSYGHDAGDSVLIFIAKMLQQMMPDPHIVARFGGEEFCVFVYGLTGKKAISLFEEFRETIANTEIQYGDHAIRITISAGVSSSTKDSLEAMINRADKLLYQAKHLGRNRVISD